MVRGRFVPLLYPSCVLSDIVTTTIYHERIEQSQVAQPCVNGDWLYRWERANFDPHKIDTPQPITKKVVTGDYIGDPYSCAKLGAHMSTGGIWAYGWNITKIIFIYTFLGTHLVTPTGQKRRRIFTHDGSNDADSRKDVLLGYVHIAPHLGGQPPKTILGRE